MLLRIALCMVAAAGLSACQVRIQQGLDERQANELQGLLVERGYEAKKVAIAGKTPSFTIEVDEAHASDAVRVLAELGLPRPRSPTTAELLGSGAAWVPSAGEDRTRQVLGLSGDIAQTLETVDGVASARVHLAMPAPPRPGQTAGQVKAAAFLRIRPGAGERAAALRDELRALIAGGVEGLSPDNVTLVLSEVTSAVPAPSRSARWVRPKVAAALCGAGAVVLAVALTMALSRLRALRSRVVQVAQPLQVATSARKAA